MVSGKVTAAFALLRVYIYIYICKIMTVKGWCWTLCAVNHLCYVFSPLFRFWSEFGSLQHFMRCSLLFSQDCVVAYS